MAEIGTLPAIVRLREIAAQSNQSLLTEGPVHPDHALLDLCANIALARHDAKEAWDRWRADFVPLYQRESRPEAAAHSAVVEQTCKDTDRDLSHLLGHAGKIRATTPAGIYAKALAIRASKHGASTLAQSLADDLIENPTLRTALEPKGGSPSGQPTGPVLFAGTLTE